MVVLGFKLEVGSPCGKVCGSCAGYFLIVSAGAADGTTFGVGRTFGVVVGAPSMLGGVAGANRTRLPYFPASRTALVKMGTLANLLDVMARCDRL